MKPIDLSQILRKYEDKWVALDKSRTKVLAFGQSLEEALNLAKSKYAEVPIVTYVPRLDLDYVG